MVEYPAGSDGPFGLHTDELPISPRRSM
jgi:hypothetical protein